ncbi:DUF4388 domain-containing protein [Vulgatibacter incomptus]|uniref:PatA-like N-terminal domain-containing protein n=1 Tax=Vulgatibacter incomptus TaxID=1391653 RepID=A0A0K1PC17_9BACT|nr:DUF4388 domain-containing protein [Vulgatibacter incomptus]AKU91070.1 hypothetical protein AKJ08_1457 [Vulgatibacter incomptus]
MADLSGDLAFLPASELLRFLAARAASGTVVASRGTQEKRLVVHEGCAVSATSSDPREYVGQILIAGGHLGEDAFERALQEQLASRAPLGRILVTSAQVPEAAVRRALEFKVLETGIELCTWEKGAFSFTVERGPPVDPGVSMRAIPLRELVDAAEERKQAWTRLRATFPSGATRVSLARGRTPPPQERGSAVARLFELLREGRSIDELLLFLHATEFQLYAKLHSLHRDGLLQIDPPKGAADEGWFPGHADATTSGEPASASAEAELVSAARAALAGGDAERAVRLCRKALDDGAQGPALALLREAETRLLARLRDELLTGSHRPTMAIDRSQLRSLPLTPPARYLVARMDGSRDLGAIVRVAPMREIDALELVVRLARDGVIRL